MTVSRCDACGRLFLETDSRRVDAVRPLCVSCLVNDIEQDAAPQLHAVGGALRCISSAPVTWCRGRHRPAPRPR